MKTNIYIKDSNSIYNSTEDHCRESLFTYTKGIINNLSNVNKIGLCTTNTFTLSEYYFLHKVMLYKICVKKDLPESFMYFGGNDYLTYEFSSPTNGFAKIINSFVKPFIALVDESVRTVYFNNYSIKIELGTLTSLNTINQYIKINPDYLNHVKNYPSRDRIVFNLKINQYVVQSFFNTWIINNPLYFSIVSNLFKIGNSIASFRDVLPIPKIYKTGDPLKYINDTLIPYSKKLQETLDQILLDIKATNTPLKSFYANQNYFFNEQTIKSMITALTDNEKVCDFLSAQPAKVLSHNGIDTFNNWLNKKEQEF